MTSTSSRTVLTDLYLRSLGPAERGRRLTIWDAARPHFGVRITDRAAVSFFVMRRLPGKRQPIRVMLGRYPEVTLAEARRRASVAISDLASGIHPRERERERLVAEQVKREHTFATLADRYLSQRAASSKRPRLIGQIVARLVMMWGQRPVTSISRSDVVAMVEDAAKDRGRDSAKQMHTYAASVLQYGCELEFGGLQHNVCKVVKVSKIVGKGRSRDRMLTDQELRAVWVAATTLAYPCGPFIKLLILTGARRDEVAAMTWSELDLDAGLWNLRRDRTKTEELEEKPLSAMAVDIIRSLPRYEGPHVLSASRGARPITKFSHFKNQVAALAPGIKDWRFHDLRRTMRTGLSSLKVTPFIGELCIGHAQKGVHPIYDLHRYQDEKREAMEKWAALVRSIVA
jgi:integrase